MHTLFKDTSAEVQGMASIQKKIKPGIFKNQFDELLPFVYCLQYIKWETNKVGKRTINANMFPQYHISRYINYYLQLLKRREE